MNTNTKEFKAIVSEYILNAIDSEGYEVVTTTDQDKLQFLCTAFENEYFHKYNLNYYGNVQEVMKNWLMGLPSCFNVDFENCRILEISKRMGSIPADASEKEEDKIIANWFNFIAAKTLQLMAKHNIHPKVRD